MTHLVIASTNPVKIQAAQVGYRQLFPAAALTVQGLSVPSGVRDQPMGDDETLLGAENRAAAAQTALPQADFWFGIEGGCAETHGALWAFAWVVVRGAQGGVGKGRTAAFQLPEEVAALVRQGVELGVADDRVFGRENSKQTNGAVGLLTGDVINRQAYYSHAVVLALIPFRNPGLQWSR
jgi:inosine/xanthosine triphosphatase